jgi:hypothetical protein
LAIEWDVIAVEMTLLAGIIYGAVYLEQWQYKRAQDRKDRLAIDNIIKFISNDLERKLVFVEESIKDRDFKPFFTNMWDAVILTNKQGLVSFEIFESLQGAYSWMKYYNTELETMRHGQEENEKQLVQLLDDVRKSIEQSLKLLKETES